VPFDFIKRFMNVMGLVADDFDADIARELVLDQGQFGFDLIDDRHGVGAGLPANVESDCGMPIQPG
jgi:hypothetical protein